MSKDSEYVDLSNFLNILKNSYRKIREFRYLEYSLVGLVAILALFLRTRNLTNLQGKYLMGLDPYLYLRLSREVLEQGSLPVLDVMRNTPFGFGLWLSSGWFIISRLQVFIGGPSPPWTLDMAQRLQIIMDGSKSAKSCCANPKPEWRIINIACDTCSTILDEIPRPDLGRKRMDGFFVGGFRLLLSDGHPVIAGDENNRLKFTDSEE